MLNTHHHVTPPHNPWNFRIKIVLLIMLQTLGLGTAAIERWRQDDFDRVWSRVHDRLSRYFLNPISEHVIERPEH